MTLEFSEVKNFLRVDHDDDDTFIKIMMRASRSFVETYLNIKLSEYGQNETGEELYPAEFDMAMLQLMSQWYDVRTIMSPRSNVKELPYVFSDLLNPHRNWQFSFIDNGEGSGFGIDNILFDKSTGLFYNPNIVDTYTSITGDYDISNADPTLFTAPINKVDYNQSEGRV